LLLARMVIDQRLKPSDPLATEDGEFNRVASARLLAPSPVTLAEASELLQLS